MGMKRIITLLLLLSGFTAHSAEGQKVLRTITNEAFRPGEKLTFRIHYGFIDAGEAALEVLPDLTRIGSRECYHMIGTGRTLGAFDWFFKVRDRYESVIDRQALVPWLFVRRVSEGSYIKNQNVSFNHYQDSAKSETATIAIPEYTQDLISAFYYARTIDFSKAKEGDIFPITGYLDDELLPLNIKFIGREKIKSKVGWIHCIKFRPMLAEGRVFKEQEDMTVWVSDDKNKVPVRVQTDILVGSIKMDLVKYENLATDLALDKKK
jgi:hypothetical protein